ncbi:hypothetical protein EVAR_37850_1 [Eumeta japonica]|uniref:Uncharacterized protein n=1 Tax=Eumeta variegata TaxID=151549 RepID=A0A4C1X0I2_EUMVA|nr:hypothetical protein EVAR_37850_1 [Eumeta japonica]
MNKLLFYTRQRRQFRELTAAEVTREILMPRGRPRSADKPESGLKLYKLDEVLCERKDEADPTRAAHVRTFNALVSSLSDLRSLSHLPDTLSLLVLYDNLPLNLYPRLVLFMGIRSRAPLTSGTPHLTPHPTASRTSDSIVAVLIGEWQH